jgi:hypothetical protein
MTNVVELKLVEVGDGVRLDADKILEAAKGNKFDRLAIIGQLEDGEMYVAGTANAGETLVLLELAKRVIVP